MPKAQLTESELRSSQHLSQILQKGMCFAFCEHNAVTIVNRSDEDTATLIVFGEAVNLEKLHLIQTALLPYLSIRCFYSGTRELGTVVIEAQIDITNSQDLHQAIESIAVEYQTEVVVLTQRPTLTKPGLLLMDMDSTVIAIECIDEIAKLAGVGKQVSEVTELAMQGKLDFAESLTSRVACLKDAEAHILTVVRNALPIMPGITQLLSVLRQANWKLAIASGGFTFFADYLQHRLDLDFVIANVLEMNGDTLTGKIKGEIVTAQTKADTLTLLAERYQIETSQTIALGDGANDLLMMQRAGLGVAFHAKPVVRQQADGAIRFSPANSLLALLSRD